MQITNCPFCGGSKIKYSVATARSTTQEYYRVSMYCTDCGCHGPRHLVRPEPGETGYNVREAVVKDEQLQNKAIELWNSRA